MDIAKTIVEIATIRTIVSIALLLSLGVGRPKFAKDNRPSITLTKLFIWAIAICIVFFSLFFEVFHLYLTLSKSLLEQHLLFSSAHVEVHTASDTERYQGKSKCYPQENIHRFI